MRRCLVVTTLMIVVASTGQAQENELAFDVDMMDAKAGVLYWSLETGIKQMAEGAEITLYPKDPDTPPLRVQARTITFTRRKNSGEMLEKIVCEDNVVFDLPDVKLTCGKAEWRFTENLIVFTENPVAKTDKGASGRGESIVLNLETNILTIHMADVNDFLLSGFRRAGTSKQHPALLRVEEVRDWTGLLAAVKKQGASPEPSPGKRLMELLKPEARAFLNALSTEQPPDDELKGAIVKPFNSILRRRDFYKKEAWQNIVLGDRAAALLSQGVESLSEADFILLNRLLFEAAYPGAIAPYRADGES